MPEAIQESTPEAWYLASFSNSGGQGLVCSERTGENIAVIYDKTNGPLITAAPETAAERDYLKKRNAELVAAIRGLLVEVDAHLDYTRAGDTDRGMDDAADVVKTVLAKVEGGA